MTFRLGQLQATPGALQAIEESGQRPWDFVSRHLRGDWAVSRRLSVWVGEDGRAEARTEATPDGPNVPYMRAKGGGKKFLFRFGEQG